MAKYRFVRTEIDAVQFTGENWLEVINFCGTRTTTDGYKVPAFNPVGTFLVTLFVNGFFAEMWSAKTKTLVGVRKGDWIVRGDEGLLAYTNEVFTKILEPVEVSDGDSSAS